MFDCLFSFYLLGAFNRNHCGGHQSGVDDRRFSVRLSIYRYHANMFGCSYDVYSCGCLYVTWYPYYRFFILADVLITSCHNNPSYDTLYYIIGGLFFQCPFSTVLFTIRLSEEPLLYFVVSTFIPGSELSCEVIVVYPRSSAIGHKC